MLISSADAPRKREFYWHNFEWNQAVADIVRHTIADGQLSPDNVFGVKPDEKPSVAVLVESTEHGRVLQALLPDWELHSAHSISSCLPMMVDRAIVTLSYARQWGLSVDVLMRADGGEDCPWGDALVESVASSGEMLLVDLADWRDQRAAKTTKSRHTAYEQRGWTVRCINHQQASCLDIVSSVSTLAEMENQGRN